MILFPLTRQRSCCYAGFHLILIKLFEITIVRNISTASPENPKQMTIPHSTARHYLVNANSLVWAVTSPANADRMLNFNSIILFFASETSFLVYRSLCLMTQSHMSP